MNLIEAIEQSIEDDEYVLTISTLKRIKDALEAGQQMRRSLNAGMYDDEAIDAWDKAFNAP